MTFRFSPAKYHAKPETVDGFRFASKVEAAYYRELMLLQRTGEVLHVDVHPVFTLGPGDRVRLDFTVWYKNGEVHGVDVKGASASRAGQEFRRTMQRWRHPAVELKAVCWRKKRWVAWE